MNEKDFYDDFIVSFGFGVGRVPLGGITTAITLAAINTTVQDERAIKFSTIFFQL